MSLILIYSCAFLFVTTYAKKAMLSSALPSKDELYKPGDIPYENALNSAAETEPAVTSAEPSVEEDDEYIPVEYIMRKAHAGLYPMFDPEATNVSDDIEIQTTPEPVVTTAPTTTETPQTTKPKTSAETKAPETEPPETVSEQATEDEPEEVLEEEDSENIDEDEQNEVIDESEQNDGVVVKELSPEELQELLDRFANEGNSGENPWSIGNDVLVNGESYKNQTVTIYDTKQKRLRTDNAFDLVCEITNYEIGSKYEKEATKAQAVAIYTYIKYYEQKGEYAELGTKSDPSDFIRECVEEIDGLAMFYDGKYIMAPFSASTGGYSAASKNVWGGDLPYLQSVKNDFDQLDSKNYGRVTTYTVEEVKNKIESKTDIRLSDNYSEWIRILSHNDNIYVGQISIDGHTEAFINGKTRTITGHIFRTYVLDIRSTAFTVSYSNGIFTFTTYGYGHGVGLSQVGANLYAKYGNYTFDQILHHYFTGITIK